VLYLAFICICVFSNFCLEVGADYSGWSGAQPDGVSASFNLPLHHKARKKCRKTVVVVLS